VRPEAGHLHLFDSETGVALARASATQPAESGAAV
jgi:hypothetical protein